MNTPPDILSQVPEYLLPLFRKGYISARWIPPQVKGHPWLAATVWNEDLRRFDMLLSPILKRMSKSAVKLTIEHEAFHISLAHFDMPPCRDDGKRVGTDQFIATDMEVNWWMQKHFHVLTQMQRGWVDPVAWREFLKLDVNAPYRATFLHELLHRPADELRGKCNCGGIQHTDDPAAHGIAEMTGEAAQKKYGTAPGSGIVIPLPSEEIPGWAKRLREWCRSLVETVLGERRKHSRPVWAFRQLGIHVPAIKPTWSQEPGIILLCVDISGSMVGTKELSLISPALAYLARHKIKTRIIAGDTRVTYDEEWKGGWPDMVGGGGTDMRPLFERALEYKPKAIICLTDTEMPAWPRDPGVPTLWVIPKGSEPPYGEVERWD